MEQYMFKRVLLSTCLIVCLVTAALAYARTIVSDKITIRPSQWAYYTFSVSKDSVIRGRFRAEGGSGNDIECYILDADAFENWRNGHSVRTWYNSGRVTVANIYARVPEGQYYLIFNNRYSLLTNKVVAATAQVD
jgi:hypothetical protein